MSKGGANTAQQMPVAMQQNPVPTQPGFAVGAPMGQPAGQMPYQPFSSFRGQNPFGNQFGPFNPAANQQIGAYRQQVQDWRSMRPEFAQGDQRMDFRQQMQDWRSARPNFAPVQPAPKGVAYAPDANLAPGVGGAVNYYNDVVSVASPMSPEELAASGIAYRPYDPAANAAYLQSIGLSGSSINNGKPLNSNPISSGLLPGLISG